MLRTQAMVSLETAARLTRDTALATWVVVPRGPGVTETARAIGRMLGLEVDVDIEAATIAVRFVADRRGTEGRRKPGQSDTG